METTTEKTVRCQCGKAYVNGEACQWSGPRSETVLVEVMPHEYRESHRAARNMGTYPHNGAIRIRCERSCAEAVLDDAGDWARIIETTAGTTLTVDEVCAILAERGVNPGEFWSHVGGGDMVPVLRSDLDRLISECAK